MADASFLIPNFHGGEISAFAQGRADKPDYRVSLNVCLNAFPVEIGAWTRRPGTMHAGHTRHGGAGRMIKFDFEQDDGVTLEFTNGYLRFRSGTVLLGTNDDEVVVAVSSANPAVVQTTNAVDWVTGNTLVFPGASTPLLENRQFTATKIDTTHFSIADALTGAAIDGATLGAGAAGAAGATVRRVQELTTLYVGSAWSGVRAVQAETTDILLCATVAPQALTVETMPTEDDEAQFEIADAVFLDGPYLDPFTSGVQATPSAKVGIITLSLSFPAYDATKAYKEDDFVVYSSVVYRALQSQNVNHQPDISATYWAVSSASAAINGGRGFLGTDIGRQVRLFSEPAAWAVGSAYTAGNVVSYNPTGLPGATQYWSAKISTTGDIPGTDLLNWELMSTTAAIWSWGRITGLSNIIDRALAGSASIGDMTAGGGLAAAFDGVFSQAAAASAQKSTVDIALSSYVGKDYAGASDQAIQSATVYPSNDSGFASAVAGAGGAPTLTLTLNLRGKATAPASASDGTLLGTSGSIANTFSAVTVVSTDQTTAWKYVWIEQITVASASTTITASIAELSLFNPPGTGTGTGVTVELLGPALLYTTDIKTWRLGVFSETTGYPTCGLYYEGRLWLGGAVANRFDASVSNGIDGGTVDFAPTDFTGAVAASNAITYTLNSDSANKMFWMQGEEKGITIGTQAGEFLVVAPTNGPLAPTNIAARRVTRIGCANIEPRRTEHTLAFVKRYGRKLIEFFSDANFGKFSGPNLADKAVHIVSAGIAEIAYTEAVTPVIWGRDNENALFGVTYKRDTLTTSQPPTFAGWHRHTLGSGREVESICNGPSTDGELDTVTMVTNDTDTNVRHVELLTDTPDENAALADSWFLDNAVTPSSYTVSGTITDDYPYGSITLNGLWHLNGETVQVFAAGLDCGDRGPGTTGFTDFVVAAGSLTIPFGDSISSGPGRGLFTADFVASIEATQIVVGFTYNSDGQLVRPLAMADTGARNGPALGKTRRGHRYAALISNTFGISFGAVFSSAALGPALFRKANGNPIDALTTFSGVHTDTLKDDYSYDGMLCWRVSRPWPANVVAVEPFLQTQDR
jgi:hypothetical protein